ncbi:hypothetical protein Tco_0118904, partial [Tanacetum coccineum]
MRVYIAYDRRVKAKSGYVWEKYTEHNRGDVNASNDHQASRNDNHGVHDPRPYNEVVAGKKHSQSEADGSPKEKREGRDDKTNGDKRKDIEVKMDISGMRLLELDKDTIEDEVMRRSIIGE